MHTSQIARFLYVLGIILMLLGLADVALMRLAQIDVTGNRWSSLILGGMGIVLMNVGRFMPQQPPGQMRGKYYESDLDDDRR